MKAFLCLLGALLLTATGWAYTYILNTDTGLPYKWPPPSIPITISLGTTKNLSDGNSYNTSAQAAAQTWNNIIGDNKFVVTFSTAAAADDDGINELAFGSDVFGMPFDADPTKAKSILAITTTWTRGNQRAEADTIFNTAWTWDSYRGPLHLNNVIDIQRVAIHELGHNLGLDHPDDAGQTVSAIMNSRVSNLDTVTADDTTGVQNLYGPPGVPANDNFVNATTITLGSDNTAKLSGYNTNATKETGEPAHAGNSGGNSVWWKWTAPSAGSITVDTKGSYSDTTLGIYTGSTVSTLTTIASNDDITDGVVQASSVTFTPTPGTVYYIAVDGFNGGDGTGTDSSGLTLNLNFASTGGSIPVITTQPSNLTVTAGNAASFGVTVTSTTTATYQWYFNNAAISGATNSTYGVASAQAANAGSYYVIVTNSVGPVTSSSATLTVNPAPPPPKSGGGGGAPSLWFYAAVSLLGLGRRVFRHRR